MAYAAHRHNNTKDRYGFEEELGDAVTRILHLCGCLGIDLESAIQKKLEINREREWKWEEMNEGNVK